MEIHILDVGDKQYGDCIIITQNDSTIMIDGAHPGDQELLTEQIQEILQQDPPFNIDLLVITHCHLDHIGCLPTLIKNETIKPARALVADEKLGFGKTDDGIGPTDDMGLNDKQKVMVLAMQEEDHSNLSDAELEQFLQDGITLEQRYITMLNKMDNDGCKIIRYGDHTAQEIRSLENAFRKFGFKILGPSMEHLTVCGAAIAGTADAISEDASFRILSDDDANVKLTDIYRSLMGRAKADAGLEDAGSQASAARNNQSIVIKVAANGWSALLAGDMQYAAAGVDDMDDLMATALQEAVDGGPYDFVKLTHHTAANGLDEEVLDSFLPCKLYAHTGGGDDATHPNKKALAALKAHVSEIQFARTDRNGRITVKKNGGVRMTKSRGRFNDFSLNAGPDVSAARSASVAGETETGGILVERKSDNENVEIIAKIPHTSTRVTITIDIDSEKKKPELGTATSQPIEKINRNVLGNGRKLPRLLFVSCQRALERNIGVTEAAAIFKLISGNTDVELFFISETQDVRVASQKVLEKLRIGKYEGVVIVGGYDVVPANILDVLNPELRETILALKGQKDRDNFFVWSDDIYVDLDGDSIPELPVSRIPDARRADILASALGATSFKSGRTFAVRNIHRPFAEDVFKKIPGASGGMNVSETFTPADIKKDTALGAVYYMLHGSDNEGTIFWGETPDPDTGDNDLFDAVSINNVPSSAAGSVVFAGCCWGALTVYPKASVIKDGTNLIPKVPEDSIALTYLLRGSQAFIGCTGSHYSPGQEPFDYYGRPLHDHFWREIAAGTAPALALYRAKQRYMSELPHGQNDVFSMGIEMKTHRVFTCLGLGW